MRRSPSTCVRAARGFRGHLETAAYFVVAESLANIAKYAEASEARIGVGPRGWLGSDRGRRRRYRRRKGARRLRSGRARRPARCARRNARGHLAGRRWDPHQSRDPVRAVIADDTALLRQGLARLLTEAGIEVCGEAGDGQELLRLVEQQQPEWRSSTSACRPPTPMRGSSPLPDPPAATRARCARALPVRRARLRRCG